LAALTNSGAQSAGSGAQGLDVGLNIYNYTNLAKNEPVLAHVPLPKGVYFDTNRFVVKTASGTEIPASFKAGRRWWSTDNSLREVYATFRADLAANGAAQYRVVDVGSNPAFANPATVVDNGNTITIENGALKFALSKLAFNFFDELWAKDSQGAYQLLVDNNGTDGHYLKDQSSVTWNDAARNQTETPLIFDILERGPGRVVVRVVSPATANANLEPRPGFTTWFTVYAGDPKIHVEHLDINDAIKPGKIVNGVFIPGYGHKGQPYFFEEAGFRFRTAFANPAVDVHHAGGTFTSTQSSVSIQESPSAFVVDKGGANIQGTSCSSVSVYNSASGLGYTIHDPFCAETNPSGFQYDAAARVFTYLTAPDGCATCGGVYGSIENFGGKAGNLYALNDMTWQPKKFTVEVHGGASAYDQTRVKQQFQLVRAKPIGLADTRTYDKFRSTLLLGGFVPDMSVGFSPTTSYADANFPAAYKHQSLFGANSSRWKSCVTGSIPTRGEQPLANPGYFHQLIALATGNLLLRPQNVPLYWAGIDLAGNPIKFAPYQNMPAGVPGLVNATPTQQFIETEFSNEGYCNSDPSRAFEGNAPYSKVYNLSYPAPYAGQQIVGSAGTGLDNQHAWIYPSFSWVFHDDHLLHHFAEQYGKFQQDYARRLLARARQESIPGYAAQMSVSYPERETRGMAHALGGLIYALDATNGDPDLLQAIDYILTAWKIYQSPTGALQTDGRIGFQDGFVLHDLMQLIVDELNPNSDLYKKAWALAYGDGTNPGLINGVIQTGFGYYNGIGGPPSGTSYSNVEPVAAAAYYGAQARDPYTNQVEATRAQNHLRALIGYLDSGTPPYEVRQPWRTRNTYLESGGDYGRMVSLVAQLEPRAPSAWCQPEWFTSGNGQVTVDAHRCGEIVAGGGAPPAGGGATPPPPPPAADTTPPSVPLNVQAAAGASQQILLSWSPSTDNVGISGYKLYRDGIQVTVTAASVTTYTDTGLTPGRAYAYTVASIDTSGNASVQSSTTSATVQSVSPPAGGGSSATEYTVNFQAGSLSIVTGYQSDDGSVFSAARGYGWDVSLRDNTRVRQQHADLRLDSFVYTTGAAPATWNYVLPNGSYLVSLAAGDSSYAQGPHRIDIEGARAVNDVSTQPNVFVTVTDFPATVSDGTLTLKLGGTSGNTMINYVIIKSATPPPSGGSTTPPADSAPPAVPLSLSVSPVSTTQVSLAWAASSDNVGVSGYRVYRGGTQIGTTSSLNYSVTGLTAGTSYSFTVVAYDAAGNVSGQSSPVTATTQAAPDAAAPSVPGGLTATAVSQTQINLAWNVATDNVGVVGYKVFRGGIQVAVVSATTYSQTGLTAGTTYSYTVAAYDAAGNTSASSGVASATTQSPPPSPTPAPSTGRVIEIGPSNADTSCTEEFENTANTLQAGDTLVLHGGTYSQTCARVLSNLHGTAQQPIVIRAATGEQPVLTRPIRPNGDYDQNNLEIADSSYLTLRGLSFKGGEIGVRLVGSNHHIVVEESEIAETGNGAFTANNGDTDALSVRHTHIHHTGLFKLGATEGEGLYLGCNNGTCRVTNSVIEFNYIHDLRGTSSGGNDGIEIKVGSGGNLVRHNVIHTTTLGSAYPCIFVYGGGTLPNTVEGNAMWQCGEAILALSDAVVQNNVVLQSASGLSSYPHEQIASIKNVTFVSNTVYGHAECASLRWAGATNMLFANNALYCNGTMALYATGLSGAGIIVRGNVVDGTLVGASLDGTRLLTGGMAGTAFVNPSIMDFWPLAGSPLRNVADPAYLPVADFNGLPRTNSRDVGAYSTKGLSSNVGWKIVPGIKVLSADATPPSRPHGLRVR
jgi:chitodextrinase